MSVAVPACGPELLPATDSTTTSTTAEPPASGTTTTATTTSAVPMTSTTTAADDGSSSPGTDTLGSFVDEPDGGVGLECSTYLQDCPSGLKCMPYSSDGGAAWNAQGCFPVVPDPDLDGELCTVEGSGTSGYDTCDTGSMCWDVDPETYAGTCVGLCAGTPRAPICEDPSTSCVTANDGVVAICLPVCDPLADDCIDGQACYPYQCSTHCFPSSGGEIGLPGDPCEYINVCDSGAYCAPSEDVPDCDNPGGCCSSLCHLADPDPPCLPGQLCLPLEIEGCEPDAFFEHLGACSLPP